MREVIIMGRGGRTRDYYHDLIATGRYSLFTVNNGPDVLPANLHKYITHHFDIHKDRCANVDLSLAKEVVRFVHWENPGCGGVPFPIRRIERRFNFDIKKYTSTFCYMLMYAIYCNYSDIYLMGLDYDCAMEREKRELPGIMYLLGYAGALGITVHLPETSHLKKEEYYE